MSLLNKPEGKFWMNLDEKSKYMDKLSSVFLPGKSIDKYELFSGRQEQVQDVTKAIKEPGRHVALFGERGVGKTSLAMVLHELLSYNGYHALTSKTINCDRSDDFSRLWHKTFREIPIKATDDSSPTASTVESLADLLPPERVTPNDVRVALECLVEPSIIILDEVNVLQDRATKALLADTLKTLSDHSSAATVILIGVADTVDDLIAEHRSIERQLEQVRMPRMTKAELIQIIDNGLERVGMGISMVARDLIGRLSQGFPYYTHYLGLHSGYAALDQDRDFIEPEDVIRAAMKVVTKAANILRDFRKATSSPQRNLYEEVLIACALSNKDDFGFFFPADISDPLRLITGKPYYVNQYQRHLNEFCQERRGPVLERFGESRNYRYRFTDPLMQPFAILYGIAYDKISIRLLLETQKRSPMEFEVLFQGYGSNQDDEGPPF